MQARSCDPVLLNEMKSSVQEWGVFLERFLKHSGGREPFPRLGFLLTANKAYGRPGHSRASHTAMARMAKYRQEDLGP